MVRLEEIVMIHDLRRQGLSVSAIARKTGLDRKTVRKHLLEVIKPPTYKPRPERPRQLAAFEPYLLERITLTRTCRANGSFARSRRWGMAVVTVP